MTSRKALIISTSEKGPSAHDFYNDDGVFFFDSTPDRTEIKILGVNCTTSEFIDWFLTVDHRHCGDFCRTENTLIDIGGSTLDLSVGMMLEVSFDDYFNALLDIKIQTAKRELNQLMKNHSPHPNQNK